MDFQGALAAFIQQVIEIPVNKEALPEHTNVMDLCDIPYFYTFSTKDELFNL